MVIRRKTSCIQTNTGARSAFTLTELVVAIGVVALLIGILMPSLAGVREHARRVVCGSNQRQIGLGIHLYADQWDSSLPESIFLGTGPDAPERMPESYRPQDMVTVRVTDDASKSRQADLGLEQWDGLGLLFSGGFLSAPEVYYCPSHTGEYRFNDYAEEWSGQSGEIISNYHYRGQGPNQSRRLYMIPQNAAIVSDSLRSLEELNHEGGFNVLNAGLSVSWLADERGTVASILARAGDDDGGDSDIADQVWDELDGGDLGGGGAGTSSGSGGG